jgi:hypothetical protein
MPAKIPQEWVEPVPRKIGDLAPGESARANIRWGLDVKADGSFICS